MKKSLHISAIFDQPELLENLVEKLAHRRYDMGYINEKMPDGRQAIEPSSTDTFVSGTIALDECGEKFRIPFITRFLFTCIKGKEAFYKLAWSTSLS